MEPEKHMIVSSALSTMLFIRNRDIKTPIACMIAGVLVDSDHFIEYGKYCMEEKQSWNWEEFQSGTYFDKKKTIKVIFHSWELAIMMLLYVLFSKSDHKILRAVSLGYCGHMIMDQMGNNMNYKSYFILYRWKNHWNQIKMQREKKV